MDKKLILAVVVLLVFIIGGAYSFLTNPVNEDIVTIGYLPSDHDAALFVAQAQGEYAAHGIETELVQFNNGGDLMTGMASGEVDIGYGGITPVLSAVEKGVPIKVVAGAQIEGSGIAVSPESDIDSPEDLAGKSIATPGEASIQYMLLQYYLEDNNMSTDDMNISAMKVAPMNDALNANKIDGMLTYEPYVTMAVENGNEMFIKSSEILPEHPCCVVAASERFIDENPDKLDTIISIHENATEFILENPDEAAELLPEDIVADVEIEKKAISGIKFVYGLNETYKQSIMDFMQIEVDLGILEEPIPATDIFWEG
ncbi:putative aliphatic sulfonates-binding protein precursor [Methanobrevibacter woesei]|uniref:Putative aliphatic sulfonates-binding protein n=1 Tax=Methanobrevibacter woesei TaxID=190976 RepID=A0A2U1S7L8_9EURY|nr:ABC transporter substrate-binding protein [Methanobrevibacter woesei]PWB86090.1 putative aliphatic sulfonates-binding protein precursor [Methanobrevibacter woesei]